MTATPNAALLFAGTAIRFSVQATDVNNDSLTYEWDFGDGNGSSDQSPSHSYSSAGTFTPRVTVSDGRDSVSRETTVNIRTLTSTWTATTSFGPEGRPELGFTTLQWTFNLTQHGASFTGGWQTVTTSGVTYSGFFSAPLGTSTPRIVFETRLPSATHNFPGGTTVLSDSTWQFRLDPDQDANTLRGQWTRIAPASGGGGSVVLTRQ